MRYTIAPGAMRPLDSNSLIREEELQTEVALEGSLYLADRMEIGENFVLNVGHNWQCILHLGLPFNAIIYLIYPRVTKCYRCANL